MQLEEKNIILKCLLDYVIEINKFINPFMYTYNGYNVFFALFHSFQLVTISITLPIILRVLLKSWKQWAMKYYILKN